MKTKKPERSHEWVWSNWPNASIYVWEHYGSWLRTTKPRQRRISALLECELCHKTKPGKYWFNLERGVYRCPGCFSKQSVTLSSNL
jgi:hypothetical protein